METPDPSELEYNREDAGQQTRGAISRSLTVVSSRVLTWGLAFIMTVMMPRYLGAEGYGRLYLAQAVTGIMAILVEFGLNSLVTRDVARRPAEAAGYLKSGAVLKALLWVAGAAAVALFVQVAGYPSETKMTIAVLAIAVLFSAGSTLIVSVLQATDRMRWIAASTVAEKAIYVGLGVAALLLGYGVLTLAVVVLVSAAGKFLLDVWWLRRLSAQTDVTSAREPLGVRTLFMRTLPFFSVLFFGAIYFRADTLILSLITSEAVIGYYGAAYRLFQTTYILADAFVFALFPLFCRLSPVSDEGLAVSAQKSLDTLLLVGIPITAGMFMLSDEIVLLLYGAGFAESVPLLRVLSIAIALMYANGIFVQLLLATDRQKRLARTAAIAAVGNIAVNLALIPVFGALGAAIATVVTELIVIGLNFSFLPRELTRRLRFGTPGKYMIAALVMSGALAVLNGRTLLLLVPLGVAVYFVAVAVLKAVPPEDRAALKAALLRMRNR